MYNVAFVYTRKAKKGYEGVRTWTTFKNKAEFEAWYTPEIKAKEEVLEEGISDERCIELVRKTPIACYAASAVQDATNQQTGKVNRHVLKMRLQQVALAAALRV